MTTALYPFVSGSSQADKVLELINIRNAITEVKLNTTNCTLGEPTPIDPLLNGGRNTSIMITAILGKDYHGSKEGFYTRLDIGAFLGSIRPSVPIAAAGDTVDLSVVVSWLRSHHGLDVTVSDFTMSAVDTSTLPVSGLLTTTSTSLLWLGSLEFDVVLDSNDLNNVIVDGSADGFEYPSGDSTKAQAEAYSWSLDGTEFIAEISTKIAGDQADTTAVTELLSTLSGDSWVVSTDSVDFNLSGATIAYNGAVADSGVSINESFENVLVILLGDLCANMAGKITIWY